MVAEIERRKISIIVPVYNKAPYLRRCLDSIAGQTYQDAQVIIVDDGSTDGSGKICDEYEKYGWEIYHTKNKGVSEARNFGIKKATGDYISFMDADDTYTLDAVDVMSRIARHGFNIYQFGHYRYLYGPDTRPIRRCAEKKHYNLSYTPSYTSMVWNKLYKKSFLTKHKLKFRKDMPFGEDEIFNSEAILANGGLYHAPQVLSSHYFDDQNSICRGGLCKEWLEGLDKALKELYAKQKEPEAKNWVMTAIRRHYASDIFKKYGIGPQKGTGKYDIVYVVKNTTENEELKYSLRSVDENMTYRKLWFYGGCPNGLNPDEFVRKTQKMRSKWENVRAMMLNICQNEDITEDFWLFNDDFFVIKPLPEDYPAQYDGTLTTKIAQMEKAFGGSKTQWTRRLRHLKNTLQQDGYGEINYAVHKPMLINRKKMLEVLQKYPLEPMVRALYGNYWKIGGVNCEDPKINVVACNDLAERVKKYDVISTSDNSFEAGNVGRWLRDRFKDKSRFEI